MKYHIIDNSFKGYDIINCTFEPAFTIEQICEAMKASTDLKGRKIPSIPGGLRMAAATALVPSMVRRLTFIQQELRS